MGRNRSRPNRPPRAVMFVVAALLASTTVIVLPPPEPASARTCLIHSAPILNPDLTPNLDYFNSSCNFWLNEEEVQPLVEEWGGVALDIAEACVGGMCQAIASYVVDLTLSIAGPLVEECFGGACQRLVADTVSAIEALVPYVMALPEVADGLCKGVYFSGESWSCAELVLMVALNVINNVVLPAVERAPGVLLETVTTLVDAYVGLATEAAADVVELVDSAPDDALAAAEAATTLVWASLSTVAEAAEDLEPDEYTGVVANLLSQLGGVTGLVVGIASEVADGLDVAPVSTALSFTEWLGSAVPALVNEALRADPSSPASLVGPLSSFGTQLASSLAAIIASVSPLPVPGTGSLPPPPDANGIIDIQGAIDYFVPRPTDLTDVIDDLAGIEQELSRWADPAYISGVLAVALIELTRPLDPNTESADGYGRQNNSYKRDGFADGSVDFRVRGYNMRCIEWGMDCRARSGSYKEEGTAQSHAIRKLALTSTNKDLTDIDWEAGRNDTYYNPDQDAEDVNPDETPFFGNY